MQCKESAHRIQTTKPHQTFLFFCSFADNKTSETPAQWQESLMIMIVDAVSILLFHYRPVDGFSVLFDEEEIVACGE